MVGAEEAFPQGTGFVGVLGLAQALHRKGVLGAHIDIPLSAAMARDAMIMPSTTLCGSPSMMPMSMKAPGSPSSPLQIRYFFSPALRGLPAISFPREPAAAASPQAHARTALQVCAGLISVHAAVAAK